MKLSDIYLRDPFIYVEDGVAYLLGTSDKQAWGGKATGFFGYKSIDLFNFEGPYVLFENIDSFWADENFWAPELHKIDNKYYIFASFYKRGKHRASQVLVSDKPLGKYRASSKPFTPNEWDCLDATYYEENGKRYAIFCHEWVQIQNGEICIGEFNDDFTELKDTKVLFCASDAKWTVIHQERDYKPGYVTDGPYVVRYGSTLFMIWSSYSKNGYALGVSKSNNGIFGPWIHEDKPLIDVGGGHGMIFAFKDKKYLLIHNNNNNHLMERPALIEIEINNEGISLK